MCFGLLNYLLTSATNYPLYSAYNITNWYSGDIKKHLKLIRVPKSILHYNPSDTIDNMALFASPEAGNALQRNYDFLARRMLNHLDNLKVSEYFTGKKEINILSIGCGYAFDFIPLNVYFSYNGYSIQYTGVDIHPGLIDAGKTTFSQFKNTSFINSDVRDLDDNLRYDLIIIQHPNFLQNSDTFEDILNNKVLPLLAVNGHVYVSFYYEQEWKQFKSAILPSWEPMLGNLGIETQEQGRLTDKRNGQSYAPEKFVYFSPKPYKAVLEQSILTREDGFLSSHVHRR